MPAFGLGLDEGRQYADPGLQFGARDFDCRQRLGEGAFLLDVQAHKNIASTDPDLVEMGQLLLMRVAPRVAT